MGRNVRAEESRAEMVLGRGVPEPYELVQKNTGRVGVWRKNTHFVDLLMKIEAFYACL